MSVQLPSAANQPKFSSVLPRIWKISHGREQFTDEDLQIFLNKNVVTMGGEPAKNKRNRGYLFRYEMKSGDLFYLCNGSKKVLLIGRIKYDDAVQAHEEFYEDWYEREYEILLKATSDIEYKSLYPGNGDPWEPNGNSSIGKISSEVLASGEFTRRILMNYFDSNEILESGLFTEQMLRPYFDNEPSKSKYSHILINSHNIILRGAPGTGKTFLARQIAADIVSKGTTSDFDKLTADQKKQIGFVQFHPSYDYTDFVEGLRPLSEDGTIGFELKPGVFKGFVSIARRNFENSQKTQETIEKELSIQEAMTEFFANDVLDTTFSTKTGNKFSIIDVNDEHVYISIPGNATTNRLHLSIANIRKLLESNNKFTKVKDLAEFFGKQFPTQGYSYEFVLYEAIKAKMGAVAKDNIKPEELKKYVFIIDEINRGEISKILGELFFTIDPGYRGPEGGVTTQYANLHDDPNEKFYIPENVYIIGTMNDIDRSVDSFDFAMRRRFRFIEIEAKDTADGILSSLGEELKIQAKARMERLNEAIEETEGLNSNYHIGASYFLKLKDIDNDFNTLWTDFLAPLLQEYVRGMSDEKDKMNAFETAYEPTPSTNSQEPNHGAEQPNTEQNTESEIPE